MWGRGPAQRKQIFEYLRRKNKGLRPVLRIRDGYPGSEFFPSRIHIKNLSILTQKNGLLSSRKYDPVCSSRIKGSKRHRISDPDPQHWFYRPYISDHVTT
jgi:hypothetical protein